MAVKFDFDASDALAQTLKLQAGFLAVGKEAGSAEQKLAGMASDVVKLLQSTDRYFNEVLKSGRVSKSSMEEFGKAQSATQKSVLAGVQQIIQQNLQLTLQSNAYKGSLKELQALLKDSSAQQSYVKYAKLMGNLSAENVEQNKYLRASISHLSKEEAQLNLQLKAQLAAYSRAVTASTRQKLANKELQATIAARSTEEGKLSVRLKARLASEDKVATAAYRQQLTNKELKKELELLGSAYGLGNAKIKARIKLAQEEAQQGTLLAGKLSALQREYTGLQGGVQALIATQTVRNKGMVEAATFEQREANLLAELQRKNESLNGGLAEQAAILRTLNAAREKEVTELTRETAQVEQLRRSLVSLNGGQQAQIVLLNAQIAARKKAILGTEQEIKAATAVKAVTESVKSATVALTAAMATAAVAKDRQKAAVDRHNAALMEEARTLSRLTRAEAEGIAKTEALTAANKRHSEALMDEARKIHGVSKAQLELTALEEREREKLARLQSQVNMLSSARGREQAALQRSIAEQTAYNKLLTMSTTELLGFTGAQQRANLAMMAGSQTAAMLRAGMAGAGSSIGMYTSATVLAATATYAVAAALRSAVTLGSDFTASMARVNSVMSSGDDPKWLKDNGQLAAMEEKVRAVGMSTSFTATQTTDGLNELAMAGLNSGNAMLALKPALDLALIGNVSMAESANIATNVLMTFGMQARELSEVVDVMAAAASNSNTNIQELASALSYAGPAAATAGVSLRDTVAAIETMSNSGIKASRAGTALRKLFVSMLNPTKKGAAMMDQYSISVLDAEGKTRGLTDIIGQMSTALKDLPGAERLSAIQNLVGVYASSPVAVLVDHSDNLDRMRAQLNDVSGAAEEMRRRISDAFTFDWKGVTSAFEEVKITAFKTQEANIRNASAELTKWLIDLTTTMKTVEVGDKSIDITKLDVMLQRAQDVGQGLAYITAGFLAMRLTSGTVMAGLAADMTAGALRVSVLSNRIAEAGGMMNMFSLATAKSTVQVKMWGLAALWSARGSITMASAVTATASALSGLAVVAGVAMRALGWAALIYSVGSALYSVFGGSTTEDDIIDQKLAVDDLKSSYDELRKSIEDTAAEKGRMALEDKREADLKSISQLSAKHTELSSVIATAKGQPGTEALVAGFEAEQERIRVSIIGYGKSITDVDGQLGKTEVTYASRAKTLEAQIKLVNDLATAEQGLANALRERGVAGLGEKQKADLIKRNPGLSSLQGNIEQLRARLPKAGESNPVSQEMPVIPLSSTYLVRNAEALAEQQAAADAKSETAAEGLLRVNKLLTEEYAKQKQNAIDSEIARSKNGKTSEEGEDRVAASVRRIAALTVEQRGFKEEVQKTAEEHAKQQAALVAVTATDSQQLATTLADLAKVTEARKALASGVASGDPVAMEKDTVQLAEQVRLRQQQVSLEKSIDSAKNKAPKLTPGAKEIKEDTQAYESLLKKVDPVRFSLIELAKNTELLARMRAKGAISAEQEKKALTEMAVLHDELTLKQDENYQSLKKIQDTYLESPYAPAIDDLIELNRLQRETNGGVKDYAVLRDAMNKKNNDTATAGAPTASTRLNDSGSSPFGEYVSTAMEKANDDQWFKTRATDLDTGQVQTEAGINRDFDAQIRADELLVAQGHASKMVEINKERDEAIRASQEQLVRSKQALTDKAAAYDIQAAKMSQIAMLGSLENIMGMMAATGESATTAQKMAFIAQKALAVAQIIMYSHVAAAGAMASAPGPFGMTMGELILAQGYASAGLVGALAIAEVSGKGTGSSSAGAFDDGGFIPYNSYGIVGEYGPEIVHGPANVTSREKSAKKLGGGGGENKITLAPVIQVTVESDGGNTSAAEEQGRKVASMVKAVVMATLTEQTRPNGALDTWMRNKR